MPGKHVEATAAEPCRRCNEPSILVVRSEPLCHDCFARYVHTKCIKRLETFRVNFSVKPNQNRKVLLPLSFGVASTTLLHVLDLHLKTQKSKTGRTGFDIYALYIDSPERELPTQNLLDQARTSYSDHQFTSLPLHDVIPFLSNEDESIQGLVKSSEDVSSQERLSNFITSLPSATARADVLATLRTRLIVEHAKQAGCDSILWGDSTTRLAEKTLAETAKGRGFSLPWQIEDGESAFGINFHYPLRDVLKKEIVSYIDLIQPDLKSLVQDFSSGPTQASTSSRNTTIDDLMKQYFESVEENFPSIVSNVVRTTGKLRVPADATSNPRCSLCNMPVPDGKFGIHGWGGDQQSGEEASSAISSGLCYGCTRSIPTSSKIGSET